ncbi:MAG: hypothetical protein QXP01_04400 [Candidatus Hadarchaeum sp.]
MLPETGNNCPKLSKAGSAGQSSQTIDYAPAVWDMPSWLTNFLKVISDVEVEKIQTYPRAINLWFRMPPKAVLSRVYLPVGKFETQGVQGIVRLQIPLEGQGDIEIRGGARYLSELERRRAAGVHWKGLSILDTEFTGDVYAFGRFGLRNYELQSAAIGGGGEIEVSKEWRKSWLVVLTFFGVPPYVTDALAELPYVGDFIANRAFVYWELSIRGGADFGYQLKPHRRFDHLDFTFGGSTGFGARFDIEIVELKGYGAGGVDFTMLCVRNTAEDELTANLFCDATGNLRAGVEAKALWWRRKYEWVWEGHWPADTSTSSKDAKQHGPVADSGWHILGYGYEKPYAVFHKPLPGKTTPFSPQTFGVSPIGLAAITASEVLVSNVYTYTEPSLALNPANDHALLLWVHDDTNKSLGQNFDLVYAYWDGSAWSTPTHVTDDTYPDGAPQVAWDSTGKGLAVWERLNDPALPITATLDTTTTQKIEIAWAQYDPASGTWSVPAWLTTNIALDHKPVLARNSGGQTLAVWR